MIDHNELFWYQFSVEMDNVLDIQPSDSWDSFPLFQLLNDFFNASSKIRVKRYTLTDSENLCLGRFHTHLMDVFAPMVIRYIGNKCVFFQCSYSEYNAHSEFH